MKSAIWSILVLLISSCSFTDSDKEEVKSQKLIKTDQAAKAKYIGNVEKKSKEVTFTKLQILNNEAKIELANEIDLMSQSLFELKYPFENFNSTYAYSNKDGTVTLLVSPRDEIADENDLPSYQQKFTSSFANNPSIEFKRCEIKKINNRDFIVVEMITPAVDAQIYNLMYVTSVKGKLLVCTFNCTLDKLGEWQPVGERMLNSIRLNDL
jgi:hypothetical protein